MFFHKHFVQRFLSFHLCVIKLKFTLGEFSKPVATIILPKLPTFLGNFCKGVKIFHVSCVIIFGKLLYTFATFYWSHLKLFSYYIFHSGIQIATVEGGIRDCGDADYPGIFVRLDESNIFYFILSAINPAGVNGKSSNLVYLISLYSI